jgi:hypothetical protein
VKKYFTKENRAVAHFTRKPGTGGAAGEDADLAGLSADQKPMARQFTKRIAETTDAAQLKGMLAGIQGQPAGTDPKRQQLQKIIVRKLESRIAELEKK